jgi:hypothetical protein
VQNVKELATALAKAQAQIKSAMKDSVNPHFKSKYADLSAVWEACREPLTKNGLSVIQTTDFDSGEVWLRTVLLHSSGEQLEGRYPLRPIKQDPQGFGSAITYARRYCLAALVGVVADEDDDGNSASQRNGHYASTPAARTAEVRGDPGPQTEPAVVQFLKGRNLAIAVPGLKANKPDFKAWQKFMFAAIDACRDEATLTRLWADNADQAAALRKAGPDLYDETERYADQRRYDLTQPVTIAAE